MQRMSLIQHYNGMVLQPIHPVIWAIIRVQQLSSTKFKSIPLALIGNLSKSQVRRDSTSAPTPSLALKAMLVQRQVQLTKLFLSAVLSRQMVSGGQQAPQVRQYINLVAQPMQLSPMIALRIVQQLICSWKDSLAQTLVT